MKPPAKPLAVVINDLQDMSGMLTDLAGELNEVIEFFHSFMNTVAVPAAALPPRRGRPPAERSPEPPLPRKPLVWRPESPEQQVSAELPGPEPVVEPEPLRQHELSKEPEKDHHRHPDSRTLTKEEKDAIRKDWNSFPPHLRTAENRRALALKYRCAGIQVFALTRGAEHFALMAEKAKEAARKANEARMP